MKRMITKLLPLVPAIYLCQPVWASDGYSIQVAALSKANPELVSGFGSRFQVFTEEGSDGLIRYKVGSFDDIDAAKAALEEVKDLGFSDAYITGGSQSSMTVAMDAGQKPAQTKSAASELGALPESVRRDVVYLDGELYVKKGESFTPLDVFLADMGE